MDAEQRQARSPERLPTGTITIHRGDGSAERWRFEISPDAPVNPDELKVALVREFVGEDADPAHFRLTLGGTASSPNFLLTEERRLFQNRQRLE